MKKWNIGNLWKKYKYVGLVVLAGILLMLLPGKKTDAQTQEGGGSFSLEDTERRMEELLGGSLPCSARGRRSSVVTVLRK